MKGLVITVCFAILAAIFGAAGALLLPDRAVGFAVGAGFFFGSVSATIRGRMGE